MTLTDTYQSHSGTEYIFEYTDTDSFDDLDASMCTQTYGVCFYNKQMVIVLNGEKGTWGLVGGTIEPGETFEQTLRREVREESNMEILSFQPVGYQKVINTETGKEIYQLRYACVVQPYGPFIGDLASTGSITEMKLIDPKDYKQYFDWKKIGDRIITRAQEILFK